MDKYYAANAVLTLFSREYMKTKKEWPLRPSEMGVLNIISTSETECTPVMLAEQLHVSKPMISNHLNVLSKKGYITKKPSEQDRRAYYVIPTEKTKDLVEKIRIDLEELLNEFIERMGEDQFGQFVSMAETAFQILQERDAGSE